MAQREIWNLKMSKKNVNRWKIWTMAWATRVFLRSMVYQKTLSLSGLELKERFCKIWKSQLQTLNEIKCVLVEMRTLTKLYFNGSSQKRSQNVTIDGALWKEKTLDFAKQLDQLDFKTSSFQVCSVLFIHLINVRNLLFPYFNHCFLSSDVWCTENLHSISPTKIHYFPSNNNFARCISISS